MGEFDRLNRLITAVYDAVLRPDGWRAFLETLSEVLDCRAPGIGVGGPGTSWQVFALVEEEFVHRYDEQFAVALASVGVERRLVGSVFKVERLSPGPMDGWAFFADWMQPQGFDAGAGGYVALEDGSLLGFAAYRERGRPGFDTGDLRLLDALRPHLQRASELGRRLDGGALARQSLESILDHLGLGLVLLDDAGRVLVANDRAQRMARRADGIELSGSHLGLRERRAQRRFDALVRGATHAAQGRGVGQGGALRVDRVPDAPPYELVVSPAPISLGGVGTRPAAVLVLIHDTERTPAPDVGLLRDLYSLTMAEARIASQLASGLSIEEIASNAGVTRQTVRNQLKVVFDKTCTHRQAELTHLLRSGLATQAPAGLL